MARKPTRQKTPRASGAETTDNHSWPENWLPDHVLRANQLNSVQEAAELFSRGERVQEFPEAVLREAVASFLRWRSGDRRVFPIVERYIADCPLADLRELIARVVIAQEIAAAISGPLATEDVLRRWARSPAWRLPWEAATLLLGGEPGVFTFSRSMSDKNKAYGDLCEQIQRAVEMKDLAPLSRPEAVIAWAKRNNIAVPASIENELVQVGPTPAPTVDQEIASTRMRRNLALLILGMAKAKYGYDPRKGKQSAARDISRATVIEGKAALLPERVNEHLSAFVNELDLHGTWDSLGK